MARQGNLDEQYQEHHQDALQRVYRVLDALQLVSTPEIESQIDILEPYRLQSWPLVSGPLFSWWRPPDDAVSLSRYAFAQDPRPRETEFQMVEEGLPGWVFPYILGGRKPTPTKDVPHRFKRHALIVPKRDPDQPWRSWIGGVEAYTDRPPTVVEPPKRIATGSTISDDFEGGPHGDRAIEGMTAYGHALFNPGAQIDRLWKIGNAIVARGAEVDTNFARDYLTDEDRRRLPPPALPPAA